MHVPRQTLLLFDCGSLEDLESEHCFLFLCETLGWIEEGSLKELRTKTYPYDINGSFRRRRPLPFYPHMYLHFKGMLG